MTTLSDARDGRAFAVYVLGAGFSRPAGLPLADELWTEVRRRAKRLIGVTEIFERDVDYYIAYRKNCDGVHFTPDTINFEEFLGFLDVEFHLGLRGGDTWSEDGNKTQVVVKTLIGEILAGRMPSDVPELYVEFAKKLRPDDFILTFNYDPLLERALDKAGMPYRLFPTRYSDVSKGKVDDSREEVVILKLHGSIDWFDRGRYRRLDDKFRSAGAPGHRDDPVFNPSSGLRMVPLLDGSVHPDDPFREAYRVLDLQPLYEKQLLLRATPIIVPPSVTKVLWFEKFKDFWWGMDSVGGLNCRMAIIGFSLAHHDDYARQVIYTIVRNYQRVEWDSEIAGRKKTPLLLCDLRQTADEESEFRKRYAFVDWSRAETDLGGFGDNIIAKL